MAIAHALADFHGPRPGLVTAVVDGEPAAALIEASAGALLLVLGTRSVPTAPAAPLGRLTDVCLRYANCPVVLVPAGPEYQIQQ
jgi:nucleotide-binding universal stress UspA family protein